MPDDLDQGTLIADLRERLSPEEFKNVLRAASLAGTAAAKLGLEIERVVKAVSEWPVKSGDATIDALCGEVWSRFGRETSGDVLEAVKSAVDAAWALYSPLDADR